MSKCKNLDGYKPIKMLPAVCVVCRQTWQVPEYIVAEVNKDNPYKCPYCREEPWRNAPTDNSIG